MTFVKTLAALLVLTTPAIAQHSHSNHGDASVRETGQAQFAAIAEIVEVLRNDPSTNWAKVNIRALRDHLVDMDNVTTRSDVVVKESDTGITFEITGDKAVAQSIQNMVIAHSPMLAAETGWNVEPNLITDGATMTISMVDNTERRLVLGLGFSGVMTIGAHHQRHHLLIALGRPAH